MANTLKDTDGERVFVTMYGLTLLAIRLSGGALDSYARREHLYSDVTADEELQSDRRTIVPVVIAYVAAIGIGIAIPAVAVVLYLALGVFLVVPLRHIRRLVFADRK
jgi:hypothetical protein